MYENKYDLSKTDVYLDIHAFENYMSSFKYTINNEDFKILID